MGFALQSSNWNWLKLSVCILLQVKVTLIWFTWENKTRFLILNCFQKDSWKRSPIFLLEALGKQKKLIQFIYLACHILKKYLIKKHISPLCFEYIIIYIVFISSFYFKEFFAIFLNKFIAMMPNFKND